MKKAVLDFVCKLQGYRTSLQNLHWDADSLSQHKLCDDIMDRISDFEDQVSEVEQSISGNLKLNKLVGTEYKATTLKKFVEDVIESTNEFYKKVKTFGDNYIGMASDCESFLSDMQRNLYLVNFTMKEDFKRNYRKMINESKRLKENNMISLSHDELVGVINEAVSNVIGKLNEGNISGGLYHDKELNFTHFAVNKYTNLIVDGRDFSDCDSSELDYYKKSFLQELRENGFNPNVYKILSFQYLVKHGIDPNNAKVSQSNSGLFPLFHEIEMKKNGENPMEIAMEKHPDWFVE